LLPIVIAGSLLASFPELPQLPAITRAPQITYLDRSGAVLGVRGGTAAPPVDLARLPPYVPAAFVAIEDRRFYEHSGFDAVGMARALMTDLALGRPAQGASTITQQLAKNLFLTSDQNLGRKTTELVLAVQLEQRYSKQQILSLYLSRVYFGGGAYGIEAASRRFFGKPAAKLSIREAAALAAVLKSPVEYSPVEQPDRSAERSRLVLDAMVQTHAITPAERSKALARPLKVYDTDPNLAAQYFVDWADQQTRKAIGAPKQDMVVVTTLDAPMQTRAAQAARSALAREGAGLQTALTAVDGSGAVRAMVGGADYGSSQFNRAVAARRQAGSAFKPFVYLTAMEAGRTPDDLETDEPVTIGGWSPRNHTDAFLGPITLQTALAQSVNTVAAKVADEVGRDKVADTARRLGITTPINTDPAMALGTSQVTPIDMASAYGAFATGGERVSPYAVERISTASGQVVWRHRADAPQQVIANPALAEMDRMLRAVVAEGTGTHAAIARYDIAGKTGTTTDSKDGWFCGFSGGFSACAWMGRDDGAPVAHLAGGGPPAEEWREFMIAALPRAGAGPIPAGPPPVAPAVTAPLTEPEVTPPPAPPAQAPDAIEQLIPPPDEPPF
jgi:penicillin-binding protein 1A